MRKQDLLFGFIKVPLDFLVVFISFVAAYVLRRETDLIPGYQIDVIFMPPIEEFFIFSIGAAIALVAMFLIQRLYSLKNSTLLGRELMGVVWATVLWVMTIIAYFFLTRQFFFSRLVLIYSVFFTVIGIFLVRILIAGVRTWLLHRNIGRAKVAIIGNGVAAKRVIANLKMSASYDLIGVVEDKEGSELPLPYLGDPAHLEAIIEQHSIEEVIQTVSREAEISLDIIEICRQNHVRYRYVPDVIGIQTTNIDVHMERGIPLLELKSTRLDGWGRIFKRTMDIVCSLLAVIVLSPLILGTALAVAIQMKSLRQVIFKQKRYGYRGKLFWFYKFQSMRVGAAAEHAKLLESSENERKGFLKMKNDPRVTTVGRFIRKTSLDELAQLWNIIKGDMSIVGPRPHMPEEINLVSKKYRTVLSIKPGLTGLAQVSGRSSIDFEDEMKLDIAYVENWSLGMDIAIIFKTALKILKREDAS